MTLFEHARAAALRLQAAGIPPDEASRDADLLARHTLGWDQSTWLAERRGHAPEGFAAAYGALIDRRARREPVAYIRGVQEFWGREFLVGPGVLIPRPETEFVIEEALTWPATHASAPPRVLDIGTGSGCLAVTLALELSGAQVHASDLSADALARARDNATRLGAAVTFHHGSLDAGAPGPFGLVVSNPPYIPDSDVGDLQPEVRAYEPHLALAGGSDGLDVVRTLVAEAPRLVTPGGLVLVEIGAGQAEAAGHLIEDAEEMQLLRIRCDLQGVERVLVLERRGEGPTCSE